MCMRQLQLFTTAELAKMRDRTKARNYSPERDEFRREHERRRAFGLARRHAERMYNSFQRAASASEKDRKDPTSPPRAAEPTSRERTSPAISTPGPGSSACTTNPTWIHAEPDTLRYRILHLPAKLTTYARRKILSIPTPGPGPTRSNSAGNASA